MQASLLWWLVETHRYHCFIFQMTSYDPQPAGLANTIKGKSGKEVWINIMTHWKLSRLHLRQFTSTVLLSCPYKSGRARISGHFGEIARIFVILPGYLRSCAHSERYWAVCQTIKYRSERGPNHKKTTKSKSFNFARIFARIFAKNLPGFSPDFYKKWARM